MVGFAGLVAATVAMVDAEGARAWLGFTFPGLDPRAGEALSILANNLRLLVAILVACAVAQLARDESAATPVGRATRVVVLLCDAVVVTAAAVHALLVGAGVGAYGGRMIDALLPHGPVELAAYSLALALYGAARRERLSASRWAAAALGSALGLGLAAVLEVFVTS
jgi:hypothetical protein